MCIPGLTAASSAPIWGRLSEGIMQNKAALFPTPHPRLAIPASGRPSRWEGGSESGSCRGPCGLSLSPLHPVRAEVGIRNGKQRREPSLRLLPQQVGPRSSRVRQPLTEDSTTDPSTAWEGLHARGRNWNSSPGSVCGRGTSASRWHESAQEPAMNPSWLGLGCRIRAEVWDGRRTQTRQPISFPS